MGTSVHVQVQFQLQIREIRRGLRAINWIEVTKRGGAWEGQTLTVKSWTDEAEEAAAAMLNCANRAAPGRTRGEEETAAKAGGAAGTARRGWLCGSSAEAGEATAVPSRRRREMNGAGREGIWGSETAFYSRSRGCGGK
jgi:hypothetical protein